MAKSSLFLVASLLVLLLPLLSSAARDPTQASTNLETAFENKIICGYEPVENPTHYFQLLGAFAVAQFNKQNGRNFVFQQTYGAAQFFYLGTSYDLQIRAIDGVRRGTFRAIVYKADDGQNVRYILNDFIPISRTENPSQV